MKHSSAVARLFFRRRAEVHPEGGQEGILQIAQGGHVVVLLLSQIRRRL